MIDFGNVQTAIYTALTAESAVTDLVSTRIYSFVPRSAQTFPFLRFTNLPASPVDGTLTASHPNRHWDFTVDFVAFSQQDSPAEAGDIINAVGDVMEDKTNLTVAGAGVISSHPRTTGVTWDEGTQTWTGLASFQLVLQET